MSTSLSESKIQYFIVNALMEIKIDQDDLGGELDNGFALLD